MLSITLPLQEKERACRNGDNCKFNTGNVPTIYFKFNCPGSNPSSCFTTMFHYDDITEHKLLNMTLRLFKS